VLVGEQAGQSALGAADQLDSASVGEPE